jgi:hypothetical protein
MFTPLYILSQYALKVPNSVSLILEIEFSSNLDFRGDFPKASTGVEVLETSIFSKKKVCSFLTAVQRSTTYLRLPSGDEVVAELRY